MKTKSIKAWAVLYKRNKFDPEIDLYKLKREAAASCKFWGGERVVPVTITYQEEK